jgi:hypothetical protein
MKGVLYGKVRQYDNYNTLQFVGLYQGGRPHGPCWVFGEDQTILVHFNQGHLVPQNVILLDKKSSMMGQLVNESYLEAAYQVKLENTGDFKCIQVVQIPSKNVHISSENSLSLPKRRLFKKLKRSELFERTRRRKLRSNFRRSGSEFIMLRMHL